MTNNKLSELEIKLFNATIKFLEEIEKEEKETFRNLDIVLRKSFKSENSTDISAVSYFPERTNYCFLKYCKNSGKLNIYFNQEIKERPYDKKYKEFILKEIPECKEVEII